MKIKNIGKSFLNLIISKIKNKDETFFEKNDTRSFIESEIFPYSYLLSPLFIRVYIKPFKDKFLFNIDLYTGSREDLKVSDQTICYLIRKESDKVFDSFEEAKEACANRVKEIFEKEG